MADIKPASGNIMRRFETMIQRFEGILHRSTDAFTDAKARQLQTMRQTFDAQRSSNSWKTWSALLSTVAGGAASIKYAQLPGPPKKGHIDRYYNERKKYEVASQLFPKAGELASGALHGKEITANKEQQTISAEMAQVDAALNRLQSISQTFQTAMQRHQQQVDEARRLS